MHWEQNWLKVCWSPMPGLKLMVTGVWNRTQENLTLGLRQVCSVGMGSKLFPWRQGSREDWAYVTAKCKEALGYIGGSPCK